MILFCCRIRDVFVFLPYFTDSDFLFFRNWYVFVHLFLFKYYLNWFCSVAEAEMLSYFYRIFTDSYFLFSRNWYVLIHLLLIKYYLNWLCSAAEALRRSVRCVSCSSQLYMFYDVIYKKETFVFLRLSNSCFSELAARLYICFRVNII